MKNGVFWDVTLRANFVPSSPILVTLMKEALSSSETSVLTTATRRNIPEDDLNYPETQKPDSCAGHSEAQ
jgi:hypothetical protein